MTGGHVESYVGIKASYKYNPFTAGWTSLGEMNNPRWYPTATALPDGSALVIGGQKSGNGPGNLSSYNNEPQVLLPGATSWTSLTAATRHLEYYPFMFVAPNGKVFLAGPDPATAFLDFTGTGAWTDTASTLSGIRRWGSAVMYSPGKVLVVGGASGGWYSYSTPTATAEKIDLTQSPPQWASAGSMPSGPRKLHNATLLPNGTVLVTGGTRGAEGPNNNPGANSPALEAEIWSPTSGWSVKASTRTYRAYHSTALLLPDGRVLYAGGDKAFVTGTGGNAIGQEKTSAEFFSPPYLFNGDDPATRPTITSISPAAVGYSSTIDVATPDPSGITKVTLVTLGSVTHGFNMSQRIYFPSAV